MFDSVNTIMLDTDEVEVSFILIYIVSLAEETLVAEK